MHLFIWKIHANFHKNFLTSNIQIRLSLEKKKLPFSYSFYDKIFPTYFQVILSNTHQIHQHTFQSLVFGHLRYSLLLLRLCRCAMPLLYLTIPSLWWPLLYELYSTALNLFPLSLHFSLNWKKEKYEMLTSAALLRALLATTQKRFFLTNYNVILKTTD